MCVTGLSVGFVESLLRRDLGPLLCHLKSTWRPSFVQVTGDLFTSRHIHAFAPTRMRLPLLLIHVDLQAKKVGTLENLRIYHELHLYHSRKC